MRPRQPRHAVRLSARLRDDRGWRDLQILNLSEGGLRGRCLDAPERGAYLEIRRGHRIIVAKVVWSHGDQFGMASQTHIDIPAFVKQAELAQAFDVSAATRPFERRSSPRKTTNADFSRYRGRALEFFGVLAAIAVLVSTVGDVVSHGLRSSMTKVEAGLVRPGRSS